MEQWEVSVRHALIALTNALGWHELGITSLGSIPHLMRSQRPKQLTSTSIPSVPSDLARCVLNNIWKFIIPPIIFTSRALPRSLSFVARSKVTYVTGRVGGGGGVGKYFSLVCPKTMIEEITINEHVRTFIGQGAVTSEMTAYRLAPAAAVDNRYRRRPLDRPSVLRSPSSRHASRFLFLGALYPKRIPPLDGCVELRCPRRRLPTLFTSHIAVNTAGGQGTVTSTYIGFTLLHAC